MDKKSYDAIRVLFITRKWPPAIGGMETYSLELTAELANNAAIALTKRVLPGKADGHPPGPVALLMFILTNIWFLLRHGRSFDVIHIGDFVLAPLGVIARWFCRPARVVCMVHGLDIIFGHRQGLLPAIYRLFIATMRKFGCADGYIANSTNTASLCQQKQLTPVQTIPLGVNVDAEPALGASPKPFILFLGRLIKRKGAAWFAQQIYPHLQQDYRFVVVGKTWDQAEQDVLDKCDGIERLGFVSDETLAELKRDCLLAVMPNQPSENVTDVEGFGLVAVELAVSGIALVASNIEGLTSAIQDQQTGFLVPHDDVDCWLERIRAVASWSEDTREQFKRRCSQFAKQYYSWQRVADDHVDYYRQQINQSAVTEGADN